MNKAQMKNLLVDKGERYGLIAAGGIMLLFMILGVMELSGKADPEKYFTAMDKNATTVSNTVRGPVDIKSVKPLPDVILNPQTVQGPYKSFWLNNLFFDPNAPPDKRRVNPMALALTDTQADFIAARIYAYDIREGPGGQLLIGVLVKSKALKDKPSNETNPQFLEDLKKRFHLPGIPRKASQPPAGNGAAGNPVQPGVAGGQQAPAGPRPGGERMNPRRENGALVDETERMGIQYVPLDPEKLKDYRFALTIYPQRMVIIHAAVQYRAQIKEIQNALRLKDPEEVFNVYPGETVPLFRGFVVQRRALSLDDGKTVEEDWADLNVQQNYSEIKRRRYEELEEDEKTNYLLLSWEHRLVMPLYRLLGDKYPDIRIPALLETIKTQVALDKPPEAPKTPSQFDPSDVFAPSNTPSGTSGQPNIGGREGVAKRPAAREGDPNKPVPFKELPEYKLVRIVDNNIIPGRLYQYRIKIKLQNPNWVGPKDPKTNAVPYEIKHQLVARQNDADREEIESDWTMVKDTVSVPRENFMFAVDPMPDPRPEVKGRWLNPLREGQGLLQFQRWIPNVVAFGNNKEPVGDWLVADVVATRGMYLGGKQLVDLPLWSSESNRYIRRRLPPERGRKEDRYGVEMDPTRPGPRFAVVEVDGGACDYRPPYRNTIKEETAPEILLMDETGALQVRSAYGDRFDQGRVKREEAWKAWIERTDRELREPEAPKGFKD